jgi:hypothetical protein
MTGDAEAAGEPEIAVKVAYPDRVAPGDRREESLHLGIGQMLLFFLQRDDRHSFRLVGFDELYLNGKLCTPLPKPKIELLPKHPPVACLKPDLTEEPCESRRPPAQPAARTPA